MHAKERIRLFKVAMSPDAELAVGGVLRSGYIGQGPMVEEFETKLQGELGLRSRPITMNSCTSALDLALHLIGVGPGDRVITTPQTCTATNSPIVTRGAIPVWADVTKEGLIDPASVANLIKAYPRTKAIMAVDWAGRLADYAGLRAAVAGTASMSASRIPIIEDAAHRLPDGNVQGDYVAWSFQAIKFLTTGDGGALLTPQSQQARARLLRWYGLDRETNTSFRCSQNIQEVGYKYHMNDIAAAMGLANLRDARRNLAVQCRNAARLAAGLRIPFSLDSHYWFFPITVERRDAFIAHMDGRGIDVSQVHARNDTHDAFKRVQAIGPGPGTDWFDAHQVAVPCGWWLSPYDVDRVLEACLAW